MFKKPIMSVMLAAGLASCGGDEAVPTVETVQKFRIRLENISQHTTLPSPFAPGVWAVGSDHALFEPMDMGASAGLEALAEDGDPSLLSSHLNGQSDVAASGVFDTPLGATMPSGIGPGHMYEFDIEAEAGDGMLSLASMLVESNDLFITTDAPVPLFDSTGAPMPARDVTSMLSLWDAGTEQNQAPGAGADQPLRQMAPNTGAAEGVIHGFRDSTRALPAASRIAEVTVSEVMSGFEITVANISAESGALSTEIAPVFWVTHHAGWSFFEEGGTASAALQQLAEDGSPVALVSQHSSTPSVGQVQARAVTVEAMSGMEGPAAPGERFRFTAMPDAANPRLSFASMVVQSNDAFLALPPEGVALLDEQGAMRDASEVEAEINRLLTVWDAGTEANEAIGIGAHQPHQQNGANSGPADSNTMIRRALDPTNDLADASALLDVQVAMGMVAGTYEITLTNTSDATSYPTPFTPALWAAHDAMSPLFAMGEKAGAHLESLAEDGDPSAFASSLDMSGTVADSGVADTPVGASAAGPLMPGASYTFTVSPDASRSNLSFASMVVQSNDAFVSLTPGGVALLDASGAPRAASAVQSDIVAALRVFDAGTEANQVGGAGPDQPLRQAAANSGAPEGSGVVRSYDDPTWSYPAVMDLLRLTISPVE